jgi:hypothetical protein
MLEKVLFNNLKHSWRYWIGTFVVWRLIMWRTDKEVFTEVYGYDGNGGNMLKIITTLDDTEIARLKAARRIAWHMKTHTQPQTDNLIRITDEELMDRGIAIEEPKYIEYIKRPPHDMYL